MPIRCSKCGGMLRPHVVWFGEALDSEVLLKTDQALAKCDLCLLVSEIHTEVCLKKTFLGGHLVYCIPSSSFCSSISNVRCTCSRIQFRVDPSDRPAEVSFHLYFMHVATMLYVKGFTFKENVDNYCPRLLRNMIWSHNNFCKTFITILKRI